jgi:PAS domain S-box-containing protein
MKTSLVNSFFRYHTLSILFFMSLLGLFWLLTSYLNVVSENQTLEQRAVAWQKQQQQERVNHILDVIHYERQKLQQQIPEMVKQRTLEAYGIMKTIYESSRDEHTREDIEQMIRTALRSVRYNDGRGYFFTTDLQGVVQLYPPDPSVEGTSFLEQVDKKGKPIFQDMIRIARDKGAGLYRYTWSKPDDPAHEVEKVAYIKYFKPLNWFVGTGEYVADVEADLQQELLARIESVRFPDDTYVFAANYKGISLTYPAKGRNMYEVEDKNGLKVVQELIRLAQAGGGFLRYVMPPVQGQPAEPKISFVSPVPGWNWYLGTGDYVAKLDTKVAAMLQEQQQALVYQMVAVLAIISVACGAGLYSAQRFRRKVQNGFDEFTAFFSRAAHQAVPLEVDRQTFPEFTLLAHSANQMLEQRQKVEHDLRQQQYKYRSLLDNQLDAIFLHKINPAGLSPFVEVNEMAVQRYGYSRDELLTMTAEEIETPAEEQRQLQRRRLETLLQRRRATFETQHQKKSGEIIPVEVRSTLIDFAEETYILSSARDISERKEAEEKYATLIKEANVGIALADASSGEILECNQALADMVERSPAEIVGQKQAIFHPEEKKAGEVTEDFAETRDQRAGSLNERVCITKSGRLVPVEIKATLLTIDNREVMLGFFHDITERKAAQAKQQELERQVRHKLKLEGIGIMAGGIAHNFNNSLAVVLGSLEMAKRKFSQPDKVENYLNQARSATLRARDLVAQILTYSRQGAQAKERLQLALMVEESVNLMRSTFPATTDISCRIDAAAQQLFIEGNPGQIQEILLNLGTNATQAMDEKGCLEISLQRGFLDEADIPVGYNCQRGEYACLRVSDTGCGMDQHTLERIFDPFFTTKADDQGTGMGLATVQGIVDQHGGLIRVQSTPGAGSIFEICFPITAKAPPERVLTTEPETMELGTETVLLVDDEAAVLKIAQEMLEDLGYRVIAVDHAEAALQQLRHPKNAFDLLVTDQTMPGMTGLELAQQAKELLPEMPVILTSGYSSQLSDEKIEQAGVTAYCSKPLRLEELARTVRRVLRQQTGPKR